MKQTILLALACASTSMLLFAQEQPLTPAEKAVLKAEQQWEDALVKSDIAALEKLYDDTLIYTHSNGSVDSKVTYINAIKSGASKYESMKRNDIRVRVYGNTALVTCHWEVHSVSKGTKMNTNARYLHVYVQQKDGWKMVAHQATRVVP